MRTLLVAFEFELRGRRAAEGGVSALAAVEDFDEIEDIVSDMDVGGGLYALNQRQFEGAPEVFHGCVVVTIAPAAHCSDQPRCF